MIPYLCLFGLFLVHLALAFRMRTLIVQVENKTIQARLHRQFTWIVVVCLIIYVVAIKYALDTSITYPN